MNKHIVSLSVILTACTINLAACNSGSDEPSTVPVVPPMAGDDDTEQPPDDGVVVLAPVDDMGAVRIVRIEDDFSLDGLADSYLEFDYSIEGRVTTVTKTDVNTPEFGDSFAFTYEDDQLVSRVSSEGVIIFQVEDGQVTRIENSNTGNTMQYSYDSAGRLSTVVGDCALFYDDCSDDDSLNPIETMPVTSYSFTYANTGRLGRLASSTGDVLEMIYRPDGKISQTIDNGDMSDNDGSTTSYTYNSMGQITRVLIIYNDGARNELNPMYDGENLTELLSIVSDSDGSQIELLQLLSYDDKNRLKSITLEASGVVVPFTRVRTLFYEDKACVPQEFSDPVAETVINSIRPFNRLTGPGLDCGYLWDVL